MLEKNFIETVARQFIYREIGPGKAIMQYIGKKEDLEYAILILRKNADFLKNNPPKRDLFGFKKRKQLKDIETMSGIAQSWEKYIDKYGYLIEEE